MSASEIMRLVQATGIHVEAEGDELILEADHEPPAAVLEAIRRHKSEILALLAANDKWTAGDWQALFAERARSAQARGRHSTEEAGACAYECCVVEWLNRHPASSDPDRCAWCGKPDRESVAVVPFGAEGYGHTWLHPECWHDWHRGRRQRAQAFLAIMGVTVPTKAAEPANFPEDFGKIGSA
ncbi:hypothetical protein [Thalassobaculum litoreum]|uniref:TubC N-terminal docking domain-containing protein n=1 Tax=Thalassobaculum litoreum DSM 18839 TaxID=1123362 RepID=A0A8G2BE56_9PROT|nr:hypothetical protein [Thalassobaculum litoreum]SDF12631.1 hypothetical protein SAMN05660686_00364 [Thalassobaculum litoreum DSM 18839]